MTDKKKVFAALTGDEILREGGRLPYSLLYPFVAAGYEVWVFGDLEERLLTFYKCDEASLPQTARLTLAMPDVRFTHKIPENAGEFIYLFDHPLRVAKKLPWRKRVRVRFDLFSAYRLRAPIIAPYSMHPAQTRWAQPENLKRLRGARRRMRAFFAGDSNGYVREWVHFPSPKLPRFEVLKTLKERIPDDVVLVKGRAEIERLCGSGHVQKFVLSDSGSGIAPEEWLPTVADADFFLCPPGIVMPMCHNVIEAMAVGAIPLISYPEWFHPNLEHLTNCIAFGGKDDLVKKMRLALSMPQPQVEKIRARVIDYYESRLRPEAVIGAIEARPERDVTVLIYTELNMAENSGKLSRRSIVMKGPDAGGPLRWFGRIADR
jgi:hypothetical protein